jgi:hypothetical protein
MSAAKNVPLMTTIGFDVASEGGATNSANSANGHAASNSVLASQEGEVVAPVEEKAKTKTYITDYDITETLGEGSFGAVSEIVFFFFFFLSLLFFFFFFFNVNDFEIEIFINRLFMPFIKKQNKHAQSKFSTK